VWRRFRVGEPSKPSGRGIDVDTAPTLVVEELCDGILFRIIGSDIDVKAGLG
jgi:hypothetical protein